MPKMKKKTMSGRARAMLQQGRQEHEAVTRTQNPWTATRQEASRGRRPWDTTTTTFGNHIVELATPLTREDIPELVHISPFKQGKPITKKIYCPHKQNKNGHF